MVGQHMHYKLRPVVFLFVIFTAIALSFVYWNTDVPWRVRTLYPIRLNTEWPAGLVVSKEELMVAIVLTNHKGYTDFTSSVFKELDVSGRRIFVFGVLSSGEPKSAYGTYGKNISFRSTEDNANLTENVIDVLKYFSNSDFRTLLIVNSDMVVSSGAFLFNSMYHKYGDVLSLFRNTTKCDQVGEYFCRETSPPRVFGSIMHREFVDSLLSNWNYLQPIGSDDVAIHNPSISSLSTKESFVLRIGQNFLENSTGCTAFYRTYNFNRCQFPEWVQKGIEFYLDKCNRPEVLYKENLLDSSEVFYSRPAVSYVLYGGSNPRYTDGALANSELIFSIYPEWKMWVYLDGSVPKDIIRTFCMRDVKMIDMTGTNLKNQMSWRFLIASEPVKRYIIRDIDSRLSMRERLAVDEWIKSGKKFHILRDHPCHSGYPLNGGLWGGTHDAVPNMTAMLNSVVLGNQYLADMNFLNDKLWLIAKKSAWQHDSYPSGKFGEVHSFPTPRKGYEHVGSVFINGKQREVDIEQMRNAVEGKAASC